MKILAKLFLCGLVAANNHIFATTLDIVELRKLYYKAGANTQYCDQFYQKVNSMDGQSSPILLCYKGMASFLRCRQHLNPYYKLKDFKANKPKES